MKLLAAVTYMVYCVYASQYIPSKSVCRILASRTNLPSLSNQLSTSSFDAGGFLRRAMGNLFFLKDEVCSLHFWITRLDLCVLAASFTQVARISSYKKVDLRGNSTKRSPKCNRRIYWPSRHICGWVIKKGLWKKFIPLFLGDLLDDTCKLQFAV